MIMDECCKGKLDVSDRYAGKERSQRGWNCSYRSSFAVIKIFVFLAAYISILIAIVIIFYSPRISQIRISEMRLWDKETPDPYDRLMHYILNPRDTCHISKVMGGLLMRNQKLDGDKVVCLKPGPGIGADCIVYSFGVGNEWSFDEAMQKQFNCRVYSFDPGMTMADHLHTEGIWFYNFGIGGFDGKIIVGERTWEIKTFDSILQLLRHRDKTIDVVKMDIEGGEYHVLEYLLDEGHLNRVNHLCLEIHLQYNPYWNHILDLLKRIESEAGLRHFSTRNNTQTPMEPVPGFSTRYEQMHFELAWYRR